MPRGHGHGLAGLGTGGARRHRNILRDNMQGITDGSIRRLAYRAGIKRLSSTLYPEVRTRIRNFMETIIRDVVALLDYKQVKTITAEMVVMALQRHGRLLYGFSGSTKKKR
jgi:histone H4